LDRIGFQLVYVWQLEQGVARGPCGLVTLALGAFTPGVTEEPELAGLPPDLAPELPPELAPELAPLLTLDVTLLPGGCNATPPSMGANPSVMVARQRAKSIVLSGQTICTRQPT
jgi:hypothetical protein